MFWKRLSPFHPMTVLRDWDKASPGAAFRIADAVTGVFCCGSTGSGKTSGPARHLAVSYMAHGFSGIVLCSKNDDLPQWQAWAKEAKRSKDLCIFDTSGQWRFNFLDWEAIRAGEGAGLTINIVALLDAIAGALAADASVVAGGGGDNRFWEDALHHMNTNLVDLPLLSGLPVSLPLLRNIATSAPRSLAEAESKHWQESSVCAAILREADEATKHSKDEMRADFEECRAYWLQEFPGLSERTRSIIVLSFSMLVRPLMTRPLGTLFGTHTNVTPESAMAEGKILIVACPVQEFRLAGRVANLLWKHCWQIATLRRMQPTHGSNLRPTFIFLDEAQNFITNFDPEFQAVARSAAGCTVCLVQNRELLVRVLKSEAATDAYLANLQAKFFCQNTGPTTEYASRLLGERWVMVSGLNVGRSTPQAERFSPTVNGGVMSHEQHRRYVEPARFTTLRRGGPMNNNQVECIVYNGGYQFASPDGKERLPYALLTFNQS
jgi:hypothetical protein